MEHKHTLGPWSAEPPNLEPEYGEHEKNYWSIRAPGPNGCISHEVARLSGWDLDRDEHTARLIAAAPELLDALRAAYSDIQRLPGHTIDMLGRIEAAITKATGT